MFSEKKSDLLTLKSNRSQVFFKIDVLENFAIFTSKQHRCFPVNVAKLLRAAFSWHDGKVGTRPLRQDPRHRTLWWDPNLGA